MGTFPYIPSVNEIVDWLRQRATAATARGFVVGLSGGMDSAVVARLCQLATPGQVAASIMPCRSDPRDEADALQVADAFSIPVIRVDLETASEALVADGRTALDALPPRDAPGRERRSGCAWRSGTCRPRLRMTTLYFVANSLGYLVAGTGNRSELTIGYFTKHGDGGVDVLPIGHLLKSQVRTLAQGPRRAASRSSRSRRARDCGSARPTRPRWDSATPTSSGI